jgi:hypothetical protein
MDFQTVRPTKKHSQGGVDVDFSSSLRIALNKAATARTVAGAFDQFLDAQINIAKGTRTRASTSQNHLRDFLIAEADRDAAFPRILRDADSDFLGGSFARHSKIWPLDDIDVYFPIDGHSLIYSRYGLRLPYTVLSDGILESNPLLDESGRWTSNGYISSTKLIAGFAKVLSRHYPTETRIRRAGEAVRVQLTELGFDVVPCFSLRPDSTSESPLYVIPDGNDGWIHTNPRIDNEVSLQLQRNNNAVFRKAVKLTKWWKENRFPGDLPSYYTELAIMRGFLSKNQWGEYIETVSDATALAFESVRDACGQGDLQSWISSAPAVERGDLSSGEIDYIDTVAQVARDAVAFEQGGNTTEALNCWKAIFGPEFPTNS